ncbi:hypothetical protein BGW38_000208, partial [Lunasporangiospora selenospora]
MPREKQTARKSTGGPLNPSPVPYFPRRMATKSTGGPLPPRIRHVDDVYDQEDSTEEQPLDGDSMAEDEDEDEDVDIDESGNLEYDDSDDAGFVGTARKSTGGFLSRGYRHVEDASGEKQVKFRSTARKRSGGFLPSNYQHVDDISDCNEDDDLDDSEEEPKFRSTARKRTGGFLAPNYRHIDDIDNSNDEENMNESEEEPETRSTARKRTGGFLPSSYRHIDDINSNDDEESIYNGPEYHFKARKGTGYLPSSIPREPDLDSEWKDGRRGYWQRIKFSPAQYQFIHYSSEEREDSESGARAKKFLAYKSTGGPLPSTIRHIHDIRTEKAAEDNIKESDEKSKVEQEAPSVVGQPKSFSPNDIRYYYSYCASLTNTRKSDPARRKQTARKSTGGIMKLYHVDDIVDEEKFRDMENKLLAEIRPSTTIASGSKWKSVTPSPRKEKRSLKAVTPESGAEKVTKKGRRPPQPKKQNRQSPGMTSPIWDSYLYHTVASTTTASSTEEPKSPSGSSTATMTSFNSVHKRQ